MSTATRPTSLTVEEMLALPDDGFERELIRGELREKPVTRRNRNHTPVEARVAKLLGIWLDGQPEPRGEIVSGEAGFRLRRNPDSGVGVDVAYVSAEVFARARDSAFYEGVPVLAVEILSPSDVLGEVDDKIELYLETGVVLVWIINPRFRTVTVYRSDAPPAMFSSTEELTAEPHLPGFRVPVAKFFPG